MFLRGSTNNHPQWQPETREGGEGSVWGELWIVVRHPRCLLRELICDHPTRRLRAAHLKPAKTHLTPHWVTESTLLLRYLNFRCASIIGGGGNRKVGLVQQIQQTWRRFCKNPKKIANPLQLPFLTEVHFRWITLSLAFGCMFNVLVQILISIGWWVQSFQNMNYSANQGYSECMDLRCLSLS